MYHLTGIHGLIASYVQKSYDFFTLLDIPAIAFKNIKFVKMRSHCANKNQFARAFCHREKRF